MVSTPGAIVQRSQEDALVEVVRGASHGQRTKEAEHSRAPADLGRARRTALDVGRETRSIRRHEVIEEEEIDEVAGVRAVQGMAGVRIRHIRYMTGQVQKVAPACRTRGGTDRSAPRWLLRSDPELSWSVAVPADGERLDGD